MPSAVGPVRLNHLGLGSGRSETLSHLYAMFQACMGHRGTMCEKNGGRYTRHAKEDQTELQDVGKEPSMPDSPRDSEHIHSYEVSLPSPNFVVKHIYLSGSLNSCSPSLRRDPVSIGLPTAWHPHRDVCA